MNAWLDALATAKFGDPGPTPHLLFDSGKADGIRRMPIAPAIRKGGRMLIWRSAILGVILAMGITPASAQTSSASASATASAQAGNMRRLTYVSAVDGARRDYVMYLPRGFRSDANGGYPVVFFGVGYGGATGEPPCRDWSDRHGWVLVSFDGRRSLHYNGVAERDFDQLLHKDLPATGVPVDFRRVFFIGGSQGASGAFGIGFRHPDWFASVGGSGGFVDVDEWYPRWHGAPATAPGQAPQWPRQYNGPAWRLTAAKAYSVVDSAEQGYWLAPYIHVGERDETNRQWALRRLAARLAELGISHVYEESPLAGHCQMWSREATLEHFRTRAQPLNPYRPVVWISTNRLEFGRAGWARIDSLFNRQDTSKLKAVLEKTGALSIAVSDSVRSFGVEPSEELLKANGIMPDAQITIRVNGVELAKMRVLPPPSAAQTPAWLFARTAPKDPWRFAAAETPAVAGAALPGGGVRKVAGVEGPANHIYETPFVVVYGASGTADQNEWNRKVAQAFAEQYNRSMGASIEPVPEANFAQTMLNDKSLVLIGMDESCGLLTQCAAKSAGRWPFVAREGKVAVEGSGREFDAGEHGLYGIYVSPWNAERYVLVIAGFKQLPWLGLGWRAPFWLPDYAVFRKGPPPEEANNHNPDDDIIQAGYFDEDWQLSQAK